MAGQPEYERLSRLDAAFLSFETANVSMHVALTLVFQKGPLGRSDGGVDVAKIRRHVSARLSRVPRYRQKIQKAPVTGDFLWVDDQHFELDYHVRHSSLPQPGGDAELQERCAEILERPLNRARPLWEISIIEGLADGRFALLCKVHHCMVDGVGGMALLQALLSVNPVEPSGVIDRWQPRPIPSESELLASAVKRRSLLTV
ncbi:MAG: wax ester/triacylglycerol synthase domain-containing protein, partial [bacterium]